MTKRQFEKEVKEIKEKLNETEREMGFLKEKMELVRFLQEHPKGYEFCFEPAFYCFTITSPSSGKEKLISAQSIVMRYAHGRELKETKIRDVPPLKNVDVVRETDKTYIVRVELAETEVSELGKAISYHRVYKRTGDVEDISDDKELEIEGGKQ